VTLVYLLKLDGYLLIVFNVHSLPDFTEGAFPQLREDFVVVGYYLAFLHFSFV